MKRFRWEILLGLSLIALSAFLYLIHYVIYKDAHHIFLYLLGDIAFLPVEVLLVTMILHRLLEEREKHAKMEKLNVVIETFFSETGTKMLTYFSGFNPDLSNMQKELIITDKWSNKDFKEAGRRLTNYDYKIDITKVDLPGLKNYLNEKRSFLLRLLENPVLLEHESFTDLLMAVFHITEELANRPDTGSLPDSDLQHLSGDIKRVYGLLVIQWLGYMRYLKANYPYLFSLAVRMNPFDQNASPVVK